MSHTHPESDAETTTAPAGWPEAVERAVEAFGESRPVLVHDAADREGETDVLYPAGAVDTDAVVRLRRDAGGLLFVAVPDAVAEAFGLPFRHEVVDHPAADVSDLAYDARPSFSLTVNHRDTFTGVTDRDRARTVRALATASTDPAGTEFAAEFRVPGHVHLLRAAPGLLADRQGHTELGVALAEAAGTSGAVAGAEMLDADTGDALSPADARAYAEDHDLPYVEGSALVDHL